MFSIVFNDCTCRQVHLYIQSNILNIYQDPQRCLEPKSLPDAIPQLPSFWHPNPSCCNQEIDDEDRVKPRGFWKINQLGQRAPTQAVARFFKANLLGTMTHISDPSGHWNEERWCSELPWKVGYGRTVPWRCVDFPKKSFLLIFFRRKKRRLFSLIEI